MRRAGLYTCAHCGREGQWGPGWLRTRDGEYACSRRCEGDLALSRMFSGIKIYHEREDGPRALVFEAEDRAALERLADHERLARVLIHMVPATGLWTIRLYGEPLRLYRERNRRQDERPAR